MTPAKCPESESSIRNCPARFSLDLRLSLNSISMVQPLCSTLRHRLWSVGCASRPRLSFENTTRWIDSQTRSSWWERRSVRIPVALPLPGSDSVALPAHLISWASASLTTRQRTAAAAIIGIGCLLAIGPLFRRLRMAAHGPECGNDWQEGTRVHCGRNVPTPALQMPPASCEWRDQAESRGYIIELTQQPLCRKRAFNGRAIFAGSNSTP